MTSTPAMRIRVWGARGSIPTPAAENLIYGGNTPCVEVSLSSGQQFIFDAGTGISRLGLARSIHPQETQIFLTHFHWDHIQGLPYFSPLFLASETVAFHSSRPAEELKVVLGAQMMAPYFPIRLDELPATLKFVQVTEVPLSFGDARVSSFPLNHPQGSSGYKLEYGNAIFVYATDHEHGAPAIDKRIRQVARGADVLFYDAQYSPEEYVLRQGWGHSTWLEAARVARDAKVKNLVLFHHDPTHTDRLIDESVLSARTHFPNTTAAAEGSCIEIAMKRAEDTAGVEIGPAASATGQR